MAVRRFEWQKARALTGRIYQVTRDGRFARDAGSAGQIQRASVSVTANLAEGFDRNRPAEFQRFGAIAKGSCAEVMSHFYLALDTRYLDRPTFEEQSASAQEVSRMLAALLQASAKSARLASRDSGPRTRDSGLRGGQ